MIAAFKKNAVSLLIGAVILCLIFFLLYRNSIPATCFHEDETDYMHVINQGFFANYLDLNTIPFTTFLKMGLSRGTKNNSKTELSKFIRSANDISVYRHWHGPLYFYYMFVGEKIVGDQETAMRYFSLGWQLLTALLIFFLCSIFFHSIFSKITSFFIALVILASPTFFTTATTLATHGALTFFCILSIMLLAKGMLEKKEIYFYASMASVALTFLANEYAALVLITWTICVFTLHIADKKVFPRFFKFLIISTGIWCCVVFICWPASFLKMSIFKSYITQAYFMIFRGSAFSPIPIWQYWMFRIEAAPLEYTLALAGFLISTILLFWKKSIVFLPFFVYLIFISLTTARNQALTPSYSLTFLVIGMIVFGFAISLLLKNKGQASAIILGIACFAIGAYLYLYHIPKQFAQRSIHTEIIGYLRKEMPARLLTVRPFMPMLRYYLPSIAVETYTAESYSKTDAIEDLKRSIQDSIQFNGIIFWGKDINTLKSIISPKYNYDLVDFSDTGSQDKWLYFKLQPKG